MKSKIFGLLTVAVMVLLLAAPVSALPAPDADELGVYIVRFEGASLSSYEGGIAGLEATSPAVTGEAKLDAKSPASVAYLDYLASRHDQFIAAMEQTLDRSVDVLFRYDVVLNGMAVRLSRQEAAQVAALPGVVDVQIETIEYPDTDVGPTWIGAPGIWDGSAVPGGVGTQGEGVIVGLIDTGINHDHPSFADIGGDGYDHTNPWGAGNYVGYCVTDDPTFCNDKLIGAWNFAGDGPEDTNGHGSHTSSTAAGNHITATITTPSGYVVETQISGVAPHANIIMYDACIESCPGSALLAAANQAVADGVDVINYSISGGNNPYGDSVELAFLDATTAGTFVSTSAGNNGPGAATVAHRSPWVSTVAAATHNRLYTNQLIDMTGGSPPPPADITGQSISTGYGPADIVYAGDYGNPLCAPFTGTPFSGEIVVCDRGTYGRVEKGQNVLDAGGGGYILANDAASGNSLVADPHVLPASHITYDDGVVLKAWLASGSGHQGTITGTSTNLDPINGDIMASFSSRGPNTTFDVLKPDLSAPGVAILAAYMNGIEFTWLGGTSMASPHNAGAGALMKALYPSWSPSEIKSAIMTTSWTDNLRKEDGVTPADPFDVGAGRDNLMQAALAGIVFDETRANYLAADPALGGDPKTLNVPSLQNNSCEGTCSWTRVVSSTQDATVTWTAADSAPGGVTMTVEPATFDLAAGATQLITITADVSGLTIGAWAFDEVTLTPSTGSIPDAHLPVAVVAQPAAQPPVIAVDPESFDVSQPADTTTTHPLVLTNNGESDLDWNIYEDAGPTGGALLLVDWSDNFDSYASDLSLNGVGGWKGWGNSAAATAYTRDEQAHSTPNSVEIVNVSDLVHEYSGYTSGNWTYTAWQYIPMDFAGESYFILLNQYDDGGATNNWSTQVDFNGTTDTVVNEGPAGGTLPLVRGQWMEIRVEIDLDNDIQSFYYGGDLLFTGSWVDGQSGGGILNIAAVDLWGNYASAVYYDDLSLVEALPPVCSAPSDIPWVSVDPTSGTTPGGDSSTVDVTFDSTGLTFGMVYSGTLCVASNDPVTPIVAVPLTLTIGSPDVVVEPAALSAQVCADTTAVVTFSICNTGTVPLEWMLSEAEATTKFLGATPFAYEAGEGVASVPGLDLAATNVEGTPSAPANPDDVLWDQPADGSGAPASQFFPDFGAGLWSTDDFDTNGEWWAIESIYVPGSLWNGNPQGDLYDAQSLNWFIYADAGNMPPSGVYPGDGSGTEVWSLSLAPTDPAVTISGGTNNEATLDHVAFAGGPLVLPPGHYWLAFFPAMDFTPHGQFGWQTSATTNLASAHFADPDGLISPLDWTPWGVAINPAYYDAAFSIEGYVTTEPQVDIPWLSEDPTSGTVDPGMCQTVEVTFTAPITPGDYYANLIVDSNDPDTPEITIPVTMTVPEPADIVTVTYVITDLEVTFDATVTGTAPFAFAWDFDDGNTSTDEDPVHVYDAEGCYTVTLTVNNGCGEAMWTEQICVVEPMQRIYLPIVLKND